MNKPCLNCGTLTRGTRCQRCAADKAVKIQSTPKASSTARGYDTRWRALRSAILDRDGWQCWMCGCVLDKSNATVDHLVPLVVDREQRLNPMNLRACCRGCNSRKGGRPA
jgi:5-methylcytosine-specific restriction endonuclease McrA